MKLSVRARGIIAKVIWGLLGVLALGLVLVMLVIIFRNPPSTSSEPTATVSILFQTVIPLPTATPGPVVVAQAAGTFDTAPRLGQLAVDRPPRMSPGSTGSFFASLRIPEQYASIIPIEIEVITVPQDKPIAVGQRAKDFVDLNLTERMGVEIIAPAFGPVTANPLTQTVNLEEINQPTFWSWTLTAPAAIGLHEVELRVYQVQGDERRLAIPPRIYQIEVVAPALPFWQTPLGITLVGGGFAIVVALIGLVGMQAGRERLPYVNTKASKQRQLLKLQSNLNYLQEQAAGYGPLEVPLGLHNQITAAEKEIEELEEALRALKGE